MRKNERKDRMEAKVLEVLKHRSSVRSFTDEPIPEAVFHDILECGVHAASAGNLQPFSIIRLSTPADKKFLTETCHMQGFVKKAAENLLFCIDFHRLKQWAMVNKAPFAANHSYNHFWVIFQDVVICAQTIETAANAYGIGSCYIGTTMESNDEIIDYCQLPEGVFPVVLLTMGYPLQERTINDKLQVEDVLHSSHYHTYSDEEIKTMYQKKYGEIQMPLNDRTKNKVYQTAKKVNGDAYAEECLKEMEDNGYVNYAQYRFGLHYVADEMLEGRETFIQALHRQGIDWIQ